MPFYRLMLIFRSFVRNPSFFSRYNLAEKFVIIIVILGWKFNDCFHSFYLIHWAHNFFCFITTRISCRSGRKICEDALCNVFKLKHRFSRFFSSTFGLICNKWRALTPNVDVHTDSSLINTLCTISSLKTRSLHYHHKQHSAAAKFNCGRNFQSFSAWRPWRLCDFTRMCARIKPFAVAAHG